MKRLLCMILTGLLLFSAAACSATSPIPQAEIPTEAPSDPVGVPEAEATPAPEEPAEAATEEPIPIPLTPIPIDRPPIELTDPI